jgi:hypothetical protein
VTVVLKITVAKGLNNRILLQKSYITKHMLIIF